MEPDRYQNHQVLYIFGMVSLLLSLSLLFFTMYILPHLLFGWRYDVPEFISFWREGLMSDYGMRDNRASWLISLFFSILALVFGLCAYFASTRIDNEICGITEPKPLPGGMSDGVRFFWKVMGLLVLFYLATVAFEWIIYVPPPPSN